MRLNLKGILGSQRAKVSWNQVTLSCHPLTIWQGAPKIWQSDRELPKLDNFIITPTKREHSRPALDFVNFEPHLSSDQLAAKMLVIKIKSKTSKLLLSELTFLSSPSRDTIIVLAPSLLKKSTLAICCLLLSLAHNNGPFYGQVDY